MLVWECLVTALPLIGTGVKAAFTCDGLYASYFLYYPGAIGYILQADIVMYW